MRERIGLHALPVAQIVLRCANTAGDEPVPPPIVEDAVELHIPWVVRRRPRITSPIRCQREARVVVEREVVTDVLHGAAEERR